MSTTNVGQTEDEHFACPQCKKPGECRNVYKTHWFFCKDCGIKWVEGINLFSSWRYETPEMWQENELFLDRFKTIN
jgi:ribosomal protein L37AE/L43A